MKRATLFLIALWACLMPTSNADAQQRRRQRPSQSKPSQPRGITEQPSSKQAVYYFRRKGDSKSAALNFPQGEGVKVVEGAIKGLIIQKGTVEKSKSEKNPSVTVYSASYIVANGRDIAAIDGEGVHIESDNVVSYSVIQDGVPIDDTDAVRSSVYMSKYAMFGETSKGGTVFRIALRGPDSVRRAKTETLLGEFRRNEETGKSQIIPALEIETDTGIVTIPVKNIVKFKEKAKEPKQEKNQ